MAASLVGRSAGRSEIGIAIAVYGGFVLNGVVVTLLGPVLPTLSSQWSLTEDQAGRLFMAQFVTSILGVGLVSWRLPKWGHRLTLSAGYLLMAAGIGGLGLGIKSLGLMSVACYGFGQGVTIPVSNLLVSDWNPERRASALNVLNFTWGLGAVICPFFIAFANQTRSIWSCLTGLAATLALTAVCVALVPFTPPPSANNAPLTASPAAWSRVFACALGLLFFLYVGTETALGGWVASHAKRTGPSDAYMWLFTPSLFWGSLVLGRGLAPFFLRWLPQKKLVLLDLVVATIGIVVLLWASSVSGIWVGSVVAGFGLSSVFPINVALLSAFGPLATRAAGPMFALAGLGGGVLPWLVGFTTTRSGSLRIGLAVPLVATLVMLALHGWNAVRRDSAEKCAP